MIRSLLGVGDGVILAIIDLTRPCGLRMRTDRYTDMPKLLPHLLRIKRGLLQNIYLSKKFSLREGRELVRYAFASLS